MTHRMRADQHEPHQDRVPVAVRARGPRQARLQPEVRRRVLGPDQPAGLARGRERAARDRVARLYPRHAHATRGCGASLRDPAGARLPRRPARLLPGADRGLGPRRMLAGAQKSKRAVSSSERPWASTARASGLTRYSSSRRLRASRRNSSCRAHCQPPERSSTR